MTIRLIVMELGRFMAFALAGIEMSGLAPLLHCESVPRRSSTFRAAHAQLDAMV
jgi:hypothetical protein